MREGIARAYLEGEARPFLDSNEGWIRDTMDYKARLDLGVGVGVIDYQALYKNTGAQSVLTAGLGGTAAV